MQPKLRVGLSVDDGRVPYWVAGTIRKMIESDVADIVLVLKTETWDRGPPRRPFLYGAYARFDQAVNERVTDPLAPQGLPAGLEGADRMRLKCSPDALPLLPEDIAPITESKLDVLVDLGRATPRSELSRCTRYGVLSFAPGDGETYDGGPPGFWEVLDGAPVTGARVVRTTGDAVTTVYRSYSCTMASSERWNRGQVYHKGISFIPRVLRGLRDRGESALVPLRVERSNDGAPYRSGPENLQMLSYFLGRIPKGAGLLAEKALLEERWSLRYKLGRDVPASFNDFTALMPPPHTWWADPQAARMDDAFCIFIEELQLPRSKNHAHISVIRIGSDGSHEPPVTVLERPYHLSYPFVFEWQGGQYIIPESSHNRTIELYEATGFPYRWRHLRDLMTGVSAVDSTIVRRDGLWWLFTNIRENEGGSYNDELFLFCSDDLLGGHWDPHPLNPIVTDVRTARPAGRIFEIDGVLYRPSQDSSGSYGSAVNINRVLEMDRERYKEVREAYIEPRSFPGASRLHTYSHVPGLTVVDTYVRRSRLVPGR
jgi:hypothetical protein